MCWTYVFCSCEICMTGFICRGTPCIVPTHKHTCLQHNSEWENESLWVKRFYRYLLPWGCCWKLTHSTVQSPVCPTETVQSRAKKHEETGLQMAFGHWTLQSTDGDVWFVILRRPGSLSSGMFVEQWRGCPAKVGRNHIGIIDYWWVLMFIDDFWRLLTITGDYWRILMIIDDYWWLLMIIEFQGAEIGSWDCLHCSTVPLLCFFRSPVSNDVRVGGSQSARTIWQYSHILISFPQNPCRLCVNLLIRFNFPLSLITHPS